jgi:hypothetical protein
MQMTEQIFKANGSKIDKMVLLAELQLREDKDIAAALETLKVVRALAHAEVPVRPDGATLH